MAWSAPVPLPYRTPFAGKGASPGAALGNRQVCHAAELTAGIIHYNARCSHSAEDWVSAERFSASKGLNARVNHTDLSGAGRLQEQLVAGNSGAGGRAGVSIEGAHAGDC